MYKLLSYFGEEPTAVRKYISEDKLQWIDIPFVNDNTDYQAFKLAVLNQQPGGAVVENGDSFSLNTNPNESILEDADGIKMTIDEAKAFVGTLA